MYQHILYLGIGIALATMTGCRNCGERFRLFDHNDDCGTCLTSSRSNQPPVGRLTSTQPMPYTTSTPIDFGTETSYSEPIYPIGPPIILDHALPTVGVAETKNQPENELPPPRFIGGTGRTTSQTPVHVKH